MGGVCVVGRGEGGGGDAFPPQRAQGPPPLALQIPRGVKLALLNPYLVFARPVQQFFRRIF